MKGRKRGQREVGKRFELMGEREGERWERGLRKVGERSKRLERGGREMSERGRGL